jgi:nitroreductase
MTTPLAGPDLEAALFPLHARRSANALAGPGPDDAQVDALLRAACTAPDHGALQPYRFVVVRGAGLPVLGQALVDAAREAAPDLPDEVALKLASKTRIAPVMVVLVASPKPSAKVPEWEQVASAACAGFGLLLAADLAGFGAVWKTAPVLRGTALDGLLSRTGSEQVLGWVNLGTRAGSVQPRRTASAPDVATRLEGSAPTPWS